nr:hypothetical protein [Micromonospora arborensis]
MTSRRRIAWTPGGRAGGRAGGEHGRAESEGDTAGVSEDVPGVGEQHEAAGDDRTDAFDSEDHHRHREHAGQGSAVLPGRRHLRAVAMAVAHPWLPLAMFAALASSRWPIRPEIMRAYKDIWVAPSQDS